MKKNWNEPKLVKLDVSKTAGGKQKHQYEDACNTQDSSIYGAKSCSA